MKAKKIVRKAVTFLAVCVCGFLVAGCATGGQVMDRWMSPAFQKTEHAILIVDKTLNLSQFDTALPGLYTGMGGFCLLAPGTHTVEGAYSTASSGYAGGGRTIITSESAGSLKTTFDFLAGHYYAVEPLKSGNMVSIHIRDITNSTDKKDQKLVQTAVKKTSKVTSPSMPETLLAESSVPTPFEGAWSWKNDGGKITKYVFAGNTVYLTGWDGPSQIEFKGRFEYTDNKITLYYLSVYNRETSAWTACGRKEETAYSLAADTLTYIQSYLGRKYETVFVKE